MILPWIVNSCHIFQVSSIIAVIDGHSAQILASGDVFVVLSPGCLLTLSDALNCSVTGENDQTTYIISDLPQDSDCNWVYTWANSTVS